MGPIKALHWGFNCIIFALNKNINVMQTNMKKLIGYNELILDSFKKLFSDKFENIKIEKNKLIIETMEEEPTIIHALYKCSSEHDLDIMDYTMHSHMIQDEDENFITTLTFTFNQIDN